eukprot:CAMPEP_0184700496 /NCGR_PEP_ID=MMETSP0313-20130426/13833_1 /TAXON_ID=2792 /ORGANISM="Porphyridium aerugineum, Strain SAG 1380-2" /LENGTH=139 /DNA_ID=CAMNT_0027160199 /DNA_START=260 /DNA_END=679 /DNA_ORIENTATION=-
MNNLEAIEQGSIVNIEKFVDASNRKSDSPTALDGLYRFKGKTLANNKYNQSFTRQSKDVRKEQGVIEVYVCQSDDPNVLCNCSHSARNGAQPACSQCASKSDVNLELLKTMQPFMEAFKSRDSVLASSMRKSERRLFCT